MEVSYGTLVKCQLSSRLTLHIGKASDEDWEWHKVTQLEGECRIGLRNAK